MLLTTVIAALASTPAASAAPVASPSYVPRLDAEPLLAPFAVTAAIADGDRAMLSYTYIEAGATQYDVDDIDDDVDSYYGRVSFGLLDFLYLFGQYQNQSTDFANTDTDLISLGAGAHIGVLDQVDLFGEVSFLYSDISSDIDDLDDTTNGYDLLVGVRWMALPWDGGGLELNGGVGYTDLENRLASDDEAWGWEVGARLHFLKFLSVGGTYAKLEDDDEFVANVRFSF